MYDKCIDVVVLWELTGGAESIEVPSHALVGTQISTSLVKGTQAANTIQS